MRMRRIAALLVGASLVITAAACSKNNPPSTPGTPDKVTAEVIPIVDVAPIYLGKSKGFFTDVNIDLSLDTAAGGAAIIPGVASGQFQFGFSNAPSLLLAQTNGVPVKVVSSGNTATNDPNNDFSGLVVKDPSITSAAQLSGKKVAANTTKGIVELAIRKLVDMAGGDGTSVNITAIGFPDMVAALDNNQVDAIFEVEPGLSAAKAKGWHVLGSLATIDPGMTVAMYFTSANLAQSNPDLVARFTSAMKKSLQYASDHPDEARAIVGTYTQTPAAVLQSLVLTGWPQDVNTDSLNTLADLMVQYKFTDKRPDVSAILP
ncbi:MAG TPA: ABC transporter substrate-binding protein [Micromonosporaceae bacterium]